MKEPPFDLSDLSLLTMQDLRDARALMQNFVDSSGFLLYRDAINRVLASSINDLIVPAGSIEAVLIAENKKGRYGGFTAAARLPIDLIAMLNNEIDERDPDTQQPEPVP